MSMIWSTINSLLFKMWLPLRIQVGGGGDMIDMVYFWQPHSIMSFLSWNFHQTLILIKGTWSYPSLEEVGILNFACSLCNSYKIRYLIGWTCLSKISLLIYKVSYALYVNGRLSQIIIYLLLASWRHIYWITSLDGQSGFNKFFSKDLLSLFEFFNSLGEIYRLNFWLIHVSTLKCMVN